MKVDYSKGKIYKITNDFNNDIYVGSTCDTLVKRFSNHKNDSKKERLQEINLYKLINNIGFDRFRIELIENCPCEDKYQLRQREGYFIREIGTLNMLIAGRIRTEYVQDNKEKIKEIDKKSREKRKEKISEQKHEYYEENKDKIKLYQEINKQKIAQQRKEHYQLNKERLLETAKKYRESKKKI